MMEIPSRIKTYLYTILQFPLQKISAQVATQSKDGPHLRTMKLVDINVNGELVFLTNLITQKWKDLSLNQKMVVLIFDQAASVQILCKGKVFLDTVVSQSEKVNHYWGNVRLSVKKVFYENPALIDSTNAPSNFGVITLIPAYWEILEVNSKDYASSLKLGYVLGKNGWTENEYQVKS
ncbi:MAG: pyridoxamine 5'-phosphate oxidase family protein [Gammaproteobacteria bacterium]|nr:pyridoxamine 5'-phosphate oxidase family protein [Gammaproteobacteria bacterium]